MESPLGSNLPTHQSGFSIVEALIAAIIVGVGLLGAAKFQAHVIKQNGAVKDRSVAVNAINGRFERFRAAHPANQYDAISADSDTATEYQVLNNFLNWTVDEQTAPHFKSVNVNLGWTGRAGDTAASVRSYMSPIMPLDNGHVLYLQSKARMAPQTYTIRGLVTKGVGVAPWSISTTPASTCTFNNFLYVCTMTNASMDANLAVTVNFAPSDTPCGNPSPQFTFTPDNPVLSWNFAHSQNLATCP